MATGFPTKANFAAGDVLTASQVNDLAGTVNLLSNASAATGSQLVSNSAGTSFSYQPTPSASNPVLNSAMQVWQRGTSVAIAGSAGGYVSDRWYVQSVATGSAVTVTRQATSDTTNLPFIQYCSRVQRNSGQTATGNIIFSQSMETINSIPFAGKTVTMSFYARAGANYSGASNALAVNLISGTGTDQNRGGGTPYTGEAFPINSQTATLTTTWQRFTFTGTVGATATELAFYTFYTPTGTAGANDYFEITGCQIDIGSVALPFRTFSQTYQAELAACQRYYYRATAGSVYNVFGLGGNAVSTTSSRILFSSPVTMLKNPTSVDFSNVVVGTQGNTAYAVSAITLGDLGPTNTTLIVTNSASGYSSGAYIQLFANNNAAAYVALNSEL